MTEIENFLRRFPDYEVTPEQLAFAKYLEQQGLRFLIDFGFENAERIAWELVEVEGTVQ
jgi:hypothetical protein